MYPRSTHDAAYQWFLSMSMRGMIPGFLGRPDEGGTYTFPVPGRSGFTYVRLWNGDLTTLSECVNQRAPAEPNNMVWMQRVSGVLTVMYSDPITAANLYGDNVGSAGIAPHSSSDGVLALSSGSITDLLVYPPDSAHVGLNVQVGAGLTPYGYLTLAHHDVSSYLPPTAGMRWWVLCYVDTDGTIKFSTTGSIETETAVDQMLLDNGGSTSVPALASLTIGAGWIPLAGIVLDNGQTAVDSNTRIVRWSFLFGNEPDAGGTLELTDGVTDLTAVAKITVAGATVGGTSAAATLTISSGATLTNYKAYLTSDVTLSTTNAYFDIVSLSLGVGTWDVDVSVLGQGQAGSASTFYGKIWDGTTVYDSCQQTVAVSSFTQFGTGTTITLSSPATIKFSVACDVSTNRKILASMSANATGATNTASKIKAVQIA